MTNKGKNDPFKMLQILQDNMNRLLEESMMKQIDHEGVSDCGSWKPTVDVHEETHEYVIKAELPGILDKDLEINVDNNILKISGERQFPEDIKEENYHRLERVYGKFKREFPLSNQVEVEDIEAVFENGVLIVKLPKSNEAKSKKIDIKSG